MMGPPGFEPAIQTDERVQAGKMARIGRQDAGGPSQEAER
jgi:hypothetical protein